MKMFIFIFSLSLYGSAFAGEITESIQAQVVENAKIKSLRVYNDLGKVRDLQFTPNISNQIYCNIDNTKIGVVACTVTDDNTEIGWTEGFQITWLVEHPGAQNERFWFQKLEKIEH